MKYIIHGNPIPLARIRFNQNGRCWDSQKSMKLVCGISLSGQHDNQPLYEGPLHLDVSFFFPIPNSKWMKKNAFIGKPFTQKPDLDNLLKWICDISNGILFKDDVQIVSISAKKLYGADQDGRTEFELREIKC